MEEDNNQLAEAIRRLDEITRPAKQAVEQISNYVQKIVEPLREAISQINFSSYFDNLLTPMKQLAIKIDEAKKDPDSIINYMSYVKNLSKYFWAMPYNIDTAELKHIFEHVNTEKEFDDYMKKYFTKQKLQYLFNDIKLKIQKKHIIIFRQIEQSFYNRQYSLINNAIISIIDDELSYYTVNKSETKRKDIFLPLIEEFRRQSMDECNFLDLFYLQMLNNNLNLLFDNVDFRKIVINNNKTIRRHATQHGKKYSNQKIVSIMLLNTLYNLLFIREDLKRYRSKLKIKKESDGSKRYMLIKNTKK